MVAGKIIDAEKHFQLTHQFSDFSLIDFPLGTPPDWTSCWKFPFFRPGRFLQPGAPSFWNPKLCVTAGNKPTQKKHVTRLTFPYRIQW